MSAPAEDVHAGPSPAEPMPRPQPLSLLQPLSVPQRPAPLLPELLSVGGQAQDWLPGFGPREAVPNFVAALVPPGRPAPARLLPEPPVTPTAAPATSLAPAAPSPSPSVALAPGEACPPDMVAVEGEYCPYVTQTCVRWLDPETKLQCAEFERTPDAARCPTRTEHKRFCIDRYEWPNAAGALPVYMASWDDAKASCEAAGKRLCSDTEWTLACEGPERQPYPYGEGYVRDDQACNIDKPYIWPHAERIFDAKTRDDELARLDQREPSGTRAACVSPYGVHDLVGNVDEWVTNESQGGKPFRSGLKGGYWGPVRTRCRPMTTAHDETFRYYQIGFRCCGEEAKPASEVREPPLARR